MQFTTDPVELLTALQRVIGQAVIAESGAEAWEGVRRRALGRLEEFTSVVEVDPAGDELLAAWAAGLQA